MKTRHSLLLRLYLVSCVAVMGLVLAGPAEATNMNGFMPEPGHGDLAISYTNEGYDQFWVGDVKVSDPGVGEVEIESLAAWFQWGLMENLALVVDAAYVDASSDGLGGFGESGLQDASVLLKYRFLASGPHRLVGGVGVRTALSDYEANLPVDLGDDTTDALLRLVYQAEAGNFYFSQQVGYDFRSDDAPDDIPLYTELGYTFGRSTLTLFYYRLIADGGTDIGDPGFTFPSNKDETSRLGLKIYSRITERFGFSVSGFDTLDGRNSGDTTGYSGTLVFRF
ncbi:MAG TPA: hypothetical protein VKM72_03560 [Thermoanaerobaculia bacterium]|nr:hypothetical protein [Thermoanaerobaculia bacterium]